MENNMYKCQVCGAVSPPKQATLKFTVWREVPCVKVQTTRIVTNHGTERYDDYVNSTRREIEREIAVCPACLKKLNAGADLDELMLMEGQVVAVKPVRSTCEKMFDDGDELPNYDW
jgi:hypothetical protein